MELRQLRYFVATVDHGSISRAAAILHIAQPALSHQIKLLELDLGVGLLHRSPQGVLSTDAGKTFYAHAQAILKQVLDARSSVGQAAANPSGAVALGIPQSVSAALALPLLKSVHATYPDITLQLTEELTGNLVEPLRSGRLNLAILFDDGKLGAFSTSPLVEEEMMFFTSTHSRYAARGSTITLADALKVPLILPGTQHGVRPLIETAVYAAGLELGRVIEINSVAILKSALLADIGATLIPAAPFAAELQNGTLLAWPIGDKRLTRKLSLCASKNIPLTDAAQAVKQLVLHIVDELCEQSAWPGGQRSTV